MQNPVTPTFSAPRPRRSLGGGLKVAQRLVEVEVADELHRVDRFGAAEPEEEVRRDDGVALAGQPLAKAQQLRGDSVALMDDDDAGLGWAAAGVARK